MNRQSVLCTIAIVLLAINQLLLASAVAATLAGHPVQGGATLDFQFPINKFFQDYAAQGGNPRPTTGRARLIFPKNFDPARSWPILIVTPTTDLDRTSIVNVPIWISSGMQDQIAPPGAQESVYYSLKRTGFKYVRLEKFFGGHALRSGEIQRALHWFREIGKF